MQKACFELYPATQTKQGLPRMTVIIVGKRHHTRFYPTSDQSNLTDTRSGNPKNGTVVDRGVTEARTWDFFCQAHTGLQGTARVCHILPQPLRALTDTFHSLHTTLSCTMRSSVGGSFHKA